VASPRQELSPCRSWHGVSTRRWPICLKDFRFLPADRQPATNPLAPQRKQCDAATKAVEARFACSCTKSLTANPCRIKGRSPASALHVRSDRGVGPCESEGTQVSVRVQRPRDKVRIDYVFHVKPLDAAHFNPQELAALQLASAMQTGPSVPDAIFDFAREHLSDRQLVELVGLEWAITGCWAA
jgi:hypothetical protein